MELIPKLSQSNNFYSMIVLGEKPGVTMACQPLRRDDQHTSLFWTEIISNYRYSHPKCFALPVTTAKPLTLSCLMSTR